MIIERKTLYKIVNSWFPPILWALLIFLFSNYPTKSTSEVYWQDFVVKKIAHIVEYAVLAILIYRAFRISGIDKKKSGYYAILLCLLYGLSDEFHQSFTPGRQPKPQDVVFDTIGAVLAIYIVWNILPKAPRRLTNWAKSLQLI